MRLSAIGYRIFGYPDGAIFTARHSSATTDEIAMNPETFSDRTDIEILSTLAHEMCHLWQHHFGKPSRSGYHNAEWAAKMREIGLIPTSTGEPGGKETGQQMTHLIDPDGPFIRIATALINTGWTLRWQSRSDSDGGKAKKRNKTTYVCPGCGQKAWAKPDANLICGDCEIPLVALDDEEGDDQ